MEVQNKFLKGLQLDLSPTLYQPDTYVDALNFSLITELGLNTGTLRNIKGNDLFFQIPNCSNVIEITESGRSNTGTFTIFSQTFTVSMTAGWQAALSAAINANTLLNALGIISHYNSDRVIIYSGLDSTGTLISNTLTSTDTGGLDTNNSYLNAVINPKILGWGLIRDQIFIFSTDNYAISPSNGQGQVWKITYDKFTYVPVIELVYHGRLNFTLNHPIPNPGGFIGNFETPDIQKIYFTDNFNRPKTINISESNLLAKIDSELESTADLFLGAPVVQEIIPGGIIPIGTYSLSYRLKNISGVIGTFTTPTNPLAITIASESTSPYTSYVGAIIGTTPANSGKSIKYSIYNLDTSYDRIEICSLYRSNITGVPEINIIADEPIPQNGIFNFIYSGNETKISITLDEFELSNLNFDTVKSLASKNNFLFYGNVKYSDFDVTFDSKAFRYNSSLSTYSTPNDVNPNQNSKDQNAFIYQSDGITVGGSGLNISYEFTKITDDQGKIVLDNTSTIPPDIHPPYTLVNRNTHVYDLGSTNDQYNDYPNTNTFQNFHSPYIKASIKGYQRDETYRFGIVFFSKKGEESFVHWIADIRMPHVFTYINGVLTPEYPLSTFDNTNNTTYGYSLGIKFTVDVSSISNQISSYQIVRVKREDSDKTILGQGGFFPGIHGTTGAGTHHYLIPKRDKLDEAVEQISTTISSLNSPDFQFKGAPSFKAGDFIDFVGTLSENESNNVLVDGAIPSPTNKKIYKNLTILPLNQCSPLINNRTYLLDGTLSIPSAIDQMPSAAEYNHPSPTHNGEWINNVSDLESGFIPGCPCYGSKTLILSSNFADFAQGTGSYASTDLISSSTNYRMYLANYKRNITQYGGNTESQRSTNEYISTGHIVFVNNQSLTYTSYVFGGDTFVSLYDNVKQFPNIQLLLTPGVLGYIGVSNSEGVFVGRIFPVETSIDIDWRINSPGRSGILNKNSVTDAGSLVDANIFRNEDFNIEHAYNQENDIIKFVPKPIPYLPRNLYDVRIHRSQLKINGELADSWQEFKEDDYIDLNTTNGVLNQLMIHEDKLVSFQDKGIALISVNDRSLITDTVGAETALGTALPLSRYDYIKVPIGSKHQFSFTQSANSIFFFDINTKSVYKMSGLNPIDVSVAKGMSSYFNNNLNGLIQTNDNPYTNKGITSTYSFRYNEAIMTFNDSIFNPQIPATIFTGQTFIPGQLTFLRTQSTQRNNCEVQGTQMLVEFTLNGLSYREIFTVLSAGNLSITLSNPDTVINTSTIIPSVTNIYLSCHQTTSFTVAYNDFIEAFTSFYSYTPSVYINDNMNIISPDVLLNKQWIHERGEYCNFYDAVYPSTVKLLINPDSTNTKVFDNYQMNTEVLDTNNQNMVNETFTQIRIFNNHQNSDFRDVNSFIAKRKERLWNISNIRSRSLYTTPNINPLNTANISNTDLDYAERFRSQYLFIDLIYDNILNRSLNLTNFETSFRKSTR